MLERLFGRWSSAVPVIVRVIVGFTFLMYGYQKVFERGLGGVTHFFRTQVFCIQMLVALFTTHLRHGFFYGPPDKAGISNVLNLFGYALVLLILGAGPWSIDTLIRGKEK